MIGNRIEANPNRKPEPFGLYFCVVHAKKSRLYQTLCSVEPALFVPEYGSVDSSKEPAEDGLTPHCRVRAVLILAAMPGVYDSGVSRAVGGSSLRALPSNMRAYIRLF